MNDLHFYESLLKKVDYFTPVEHKPDTSQLVQVYNVWSTLGENEHLFRIRIRTSEIWQNGMVVGIRKESVIVTLINHFDVKLFEKTETEHRFFEWRDQKTEFIRHVPVKDLIQKIAPRPTKDKIILDQKEKIEKLEEEVNLLRSKLSEIQRIAES